MSSAAKRQILEALDDLPEQSLVTVAELIDFLRAKALGGPIVGAPQPPAARGGGTPRMGFAEAYAAWRSRVATDDLEAGTGYFDALRDASVGPDVKL